MREHSSDRPTPCLLGKKAAIRIGCSRGFMDGSGSERPLRPRQRRMHSRKSPSVLCKAALCVILLCVCVAKEGMQRLFKLLSYLVLLPPPPPHSNPCPKGFLSFGGSLDDVFVCGSTLSLLALLLHLLSSLLIHYKASLFMDGRRHQGSRTPSSERPGWKRRKSSKKMKMPTTTPLRTKTPNGSLLLPCLYLGREIYKPTPFALFRPAELRAGIPTFTPFPLRLPPF